jgi:hypothetical protein
MAFSVDTIAPGRKWRSARATCAASNDGPDHAGDREVVTRHEPVRMFMLGETANSDTG